MKLWTDYVQNVEGCSVLKILHLPTDEVRVYSTIDDPAAASLENLALCLAIYFASAVTLDDDEATRATLGQDKRTYLLCFKVGLEQAFAQGDFLDRPTLTGLNALAIYLVCKGHTTALPGVWRRGTPSGPSTMLNNLVSSVSRHFASRTTAKASGSSTASRSALRSRWGSTATVNASVSRRSNPRSVVVCGGTS